MIAGNMLAPENIQRLYEARGYLYAAKLGKLEARVAKYSKQGPWTIDFAMDKLLEEFAELEHAIDFNYSLEEKIKEIADISNCCDILTAILFDSK